jgi:PhnB protein
MLTYGQSRDIFAGLAAGGSISMPFQTTFWSPGCGAHKDAFGITREVNATGQAD